MIFINYQLYECEVVKKLHAKTNGIRFENFGYIIKKKESSKNFLKYDCLLSEANKLRIKKSEVFELVKEAKNEYNGDIYTIYCDGGVHNYGNEKKSIEISALTTIVFKNDKEIFRTTKVYEQFLDNNTVEILALLIGLRYLKQNEDNVALKNSKIIVSSDSQNLQEYIIRPKIIKIVIKKCTADKTSLYYSELMRELLNELNFYVNFLDIYIGWIKGHTQIKVGSSKATLMNYTCDRLCKEALRKKLLDMKFENYKEKEINPLNESNKYYIRHKQKEFRRKRKKKDVKI